MSQRAIAEKAGKSQSTVRYWLEKHGLKTARGGGSCERLGIEKEALQKAVRDSICMADCLRALKLAQRKHHYPGVRRKIAKWGIDTLHWVRGGGTDRRARPLKDVMVRDSSYDRGTLKKRLLRERILRNKCAVCGQKPMWAESPLVMVLDHANGVRDDHRLENLRLLCPNCNSQTVTFAGRNVGR